MRPITQLWALTGPLSLLVPTMPDKLVKRDQNYPIIEPVPLNFTSEHCKSFFQWNHTRVSTVWMISCMKFIPNELTGGRFKIMVEMPVFASVSKMIDFSGFVDEKHRICGTIRTIGLLIKILIAIFIDNFISLWQNFLTFEICCVLNLFWNLGLGWLRCIVKLWQTYSSRQISTINFPSSFRH